MKDNKGFTLVGVLLTLFIFVMAVSVCGRYCYTINRLVSTNKIDRKMGMMAKNKMEELKSGRIYIEGHEYCVLDLDDQTINFIEEDYNINILIEPLENYEDIYYINLEITNEKWDMSYNLIRYIDFHEDTLPNTYEEFVIYGN